tara:strand:- start:99 stop:302 length:204 start_codon:yes stop_codon:yes gene_type:complete
MNVNLRISAEQQSQNVQVLFTDWIRIVDLCGVGSDQETSMFKTYTDARKSYLNRIYSDCNISVVEAD